MWVLPINIRSTHSSYSFGLYFDINGNLVVKGKIRGVCTLICDGYLNRFRKGAIAWSKYRCQKSCWDEAEKMKARCKKTRSKPHRLYNRPRNSQDQKKKDEKKKRRKEEKKKRKEEKKKKKRKKRLKNVRKGTRSDVTRSLDVAQEKCWPASNFAGYQARRSCSTFLWKAWWIWCSRQILHRHTTIPATPEKKVV